jgi:glycosyltransferase involved in cell wall biosynthesis
VKSIYLVPAYNEGHRLPQVIDELRRHASCDTVLLLNNGSTDGSAELMKKSGFDYFELPKNLGVGHAYMRALDWALERRFDVFGTMAANGKMLASEMPRLLDPILDGTADYVTGSRFLEGGDSPNLPAFRRSSIPIVNHYVRALTGARLTDATCGYRAFRLDLLARAEFDWHAEWLFTYGLEYYLYAKVVLSSSIRHREVPITMRYPPSGSYTKIKPVTGWYQMLKPWFVARFDARPFRAAPAGERTH